MRQKELSRWLRIVVVIGWCVCAVLAAVIAPKLAHDAAMDVPELAYLRWPCLIVFWIGLVPVAVALWEGWRVFGEIGRDNSFCTENARRLRVVSRLALGDTLLCVAVMMGLLLANALHPGVFLLMLLIAFAGAVIAIAAAALSHLTLKAAAIQDENDLTI